MHRSQCMPVSSYQMTRWIKTWLTGHSVKSMKKNPVFPSIAMRDYQNQSGNTRLGFRQWLEPNRSVCILHAWKVPILWYCFLLPSVPLDLMQGCSPCHFHSSPYGLCFIAGLIPRLACERGCQNTGSNGRQPIGSLVCVQARDSVSQHFREFELVNRESVRSVLNPWDSRIFRESWQAWIYNNYGGMGVHIHAHQRIIIVSSYVIERGGWHTFVSSLQLLLWFQVEIPVEHQQVLGHPQAFLQLLSVPFHLQMTGCSIWQSS